MAGDLLGRRIERTAGAEFGQALEHFILVEILVCRAYCELDFPARCWRTKSGLKCDFVLGRDGEIVIKVKSIRRDRDAPGFEASELQHATANGESRLGCQVVEQLSFPLNSRSFPDTGSFNDPR